MVWGYRGFSRGLGHPVGRNFPGYPASRFYECAKNVWMVVGGTPAFSRRYFLSTFTIS